MPPGTKAEYEQRLRAAVERVGRFSVEAFEFVQAGLTWTADRIHGEVPEGQPRSGRNRHITGQQLCEGLRDLAIERWGYLARTVLNNWGISRTEDFGRIVYALIDAGILAKTDEDSPDDFVAVFDFAEAFERRYAFGTAP
jgi:uncharacterized repeat protein (TIGR04138 family)